jgi:hypothetical protein
MGRDHNRLLFMGVQKFERSRPLHRAKYFTERVVKTPNPAERLVLSEQVSDMGTLLPERWDHEQELAAGS